MLLGAFVLCTVALAPGAGQANKVYNRSITLEDLVRGSTYILVVQKTKPFAKKITVDITPKGKKPNKKKYPPYVYTRHRFQVVEQLYPPARVMKKRAKDPNALVARKIWIEPAYADSNLHLHRLYHLKRTRKSPIREFYAVPLISKRPLPPAKGTIVFVHQVKKGVFRYVVNGATERLSRKKVVLQTLRKHRAAP